MKCLYTYIRYIERETSAGGLADSAHDCTHRIEQKRLGGWPGQPVVYDSANPHNTQLSYQERTDKTQLQAGGYEKCKNASTRERSRNHHALLGSLAKSNYLVSLSLISGCVVGVWREWEGWNKRGKGRERETEYTLITLNSPAVHLLFSVPVLRIQRLPFQWMSVCHSL